jgi:hypothetical protein
MDGPSRDLYLLNLLRVIHLKWTGGGRAFIPLIFVQNFLVRLLRSLCSGWIRFNGWASFKLLKPLARDCQVGLTCQKKHDHMDDTSGDLFLSSQSLECHPYQMNNGWWGIYTLALYFRISLWDKWTCSGVY